MTKLYLDIDGVLVAGASGANGPVLANHAEEFLTFALEAFDVYWLSTHCDGTTAPVLEYLAPSCGQAMMELLRRVKPTAFKTLKTEAFETIGPDFVWLDDAPLAVEKDWLRARGLLANLIEVNTRKRPDDLKRAMRALRARQTE